MWISYGSLAHSPHAVLTRTSDDTPAYLRDTPRRRSRPTILVDELADWALADGAFLRPAIRLKYSRRPLARTVIAWSNVRMPPMQYRQGFRRLWPSAIPWQGERTFCRAAAGDQRRMAEYLRTHATECRFNDVLHTSSNLVCATVSRMSDRGTEPAVRRIGPVRPTQLNPTTCSATK